LIFLLIIIFTILLTLDLLFLTNISIPNNVIFFQEHVNQSYYYSFILISLNRLCLPSFPDIKPLELLKIVSTAQTLFNSSTLFSSPTFGHFKVNTENLLHWLINSTFLYSSTDWIAISTFYFLNFITLKT